MGPLAGGWLTENLSWHYAFFVNIPICIVLMIFLMVSLSSSKMHLDDLLGADWLGIRAWRLALAG
jgi:DHA2 family multidrug resistance protein